MKKKTTKFCFFKNKFLFSTFVLILLSKRFRKYSKKTKNLKKRLKYIRNPIIKNELVSVFKARQLLLVTKMKTRRWAFNRFVLRTTFCKSFFMQKRFFARRRYKLLTIGARLIMWRRIKHKILNNSNYRLYRLRQLHLLSLYFVMSLVLTPRLYGSMFKYPSRTKNTTFMSFFLKFYIKSLYESTRMVDAEIFFFTINHSKQPRYVDNEFYRHTTVWTPFFKSPYRAAKTATASNLSFSKYTFYSAPISTFLYKPHDITRLRNINNLITNNNNNPTASNMGDTMRAFILAEYNLRNGSLLDILSIFLSYEHVTSKMPTSILCNYLGLSLSLVLDTHRQLEIICKSAFISK